MLLHQSFLNAGPAQDLRSIFFWYVLIKTLYLRLLL